MTRRSVAISLDTFIVALGVLAATIVNLGGFIVQCSGLRVSFGTPSRTLLGIILVGLVRLIIDRRTGPLGLSIGSRRHFLNFAPAARGENQLSHADV